MTVKKKLMEMVLMIPVKSGICIVLFVVFGVVTFQK